MTGGMTHPDYRLPTANRMTAANVIAGLEDLMYTIAASNEERGNPHRNAEVPPMPQPVPDRDLTWHAQPFRERNPVADIPEPGRLHIPTVQIRNFNVQAEQAATVQRLFQAGADRFGQAALGVVAAEFPEDAARAEQDALAMQVGAAAEEHARQMIDWMQRQREVEQARVDALANRTRGIPNRR